MLTLKQLGWNEDWNSVYQSFNERKLHPARICSQNKNRFQVICEDGYHWAKISDLLYKSSLNSYEKPVVGDWVLVEKKSNCDWLIIRHILPRRTLLSRKQKNTFGRNFTKPGSSDEQVISANIDLVFLVFSLVYEFSLRTIERYLILIHKSKAKPVIILNKADLCPDKEEKYQSVKSIAGDIPIHVISAITNQGTDIIQSYLVEGTTICLIGSSGVGKSTLINALCEEDRQVVTEVRNADNRGRHTTTNREMIILNNKAILIDNPGLRDIKIIGNEEDLQFTFEDIINLEKECRFRNCNHQTEPGCAIREAIQNGDLDEDRFESYQKLKVELKDLKIRAESRINREEKIRTKLKKSGLDKVFIHR